MRHRVLLAVLLALAALVVCSCGTEHPGAAGLAGDHTSSTAPAPSGTTRSSALDGFPLDLGYDPENGDDHSPVRVTHRPATKAFELCGVPTWDPRAGTTDLIGVEWRGEAEWSRGRTLVLYPTEDAATAAVAAAHDALAGCTEEPGEAGYGTAHTLLEEDLGLQSVAWTDTYWFESGGEHLFDTGLTVYHLVRVGRAVLLAYEYGEGNGSATSLAGAIDRATELERPVVARMSQLEEPEPNGDAFTVTPTGGAPFALDMSIDEARQAAPDVRVSEQRPCARLTWVAPNGAEVVGAFDDAGLAWLVVGAGGATTEGATVGDSLGQLSAAYPNLEAFGTGGMNAMLSDQGAAAYVFTLDGDRDATDRRTRHVTSIRVMADGRWEHCPFVQSAG